MRITEEKEESNGMIHETLTTNPRDEVVEDESTEKEKKEDEKALNNTMKHTQIDLLILQQKMIT